jgi:hypothetical protein
LRAHLEQAALSFSSGVLAIEARDDLLRDALERNREIVANAVSTAWGPDAAWRTVLGKTRPATPPAATLVEGPTIPSIPAPRPQSTSAAGGRSPSARNGAGRANAPSPKTAAAPRAQTSSGKSRSADWADASNSPSVQAVLDVFGGTIVSVESRARTEDPPPPEPDQSEPNEESGSLR